MASIYKEFVVNASPAFAWEAIKDVGNIHTRLARGFVADTQLEGDTRTVRFVNGFVVQEQVVSIDDELRRLVYRAIGGRASHHNAFFQVLSETNGRCKILWVTDLLPDEMRAPISQMVEAGASAIQETLEATYRLRT